MDPSIAQELIDFIEENNVCDINNITWIDDEDCYIDSSRSDEMKEIIEKVKEAIEEE